MRDVLLSWQGSQFVKNHQEYGELFGEWKLYEAARSCHTFLTRKRGSLKKLVGEFQDAVDFLNPRLNNSVALQTLQHVLNTTATNLYDGVAEEDLDILLLEVAGCCVPWACVCFFCVCVPVPAESDTASALPYPYP